MKRLIIISIVILFILAITLTNVNAATNTNKASKTLSNCIRSCTEYKKIDQKECTTNFLDALVKCRVDYKTCLKVSRDSRNSKSCLKSYNNCTKTSNVDKKTCNNNFITEFFNCKDRCLNPLDCIEEGKSIAVIPNPPVCCSGLKLISPSNENIVGISGICTSKCGNGFCDNETESNYNCPKDCKIEKEICTICGNNCTTDSEAICPMTIGGVFAPANFECKIIDNKCTQVMKNITDNNCEVDLDCAIFFSHCGCNNYCRNKNFFAEMDCSRYCMPEEIINSINHCTCQNNKCTGVTITN